MMATCFWTFFKVKIRGQRADLGEIEKKVMDCLKNQVEQAIVLAIHPKQPSQKIVAFVKLFTNYQTKNVSQALFQKKKSKKLKPEKTQLPKKLNDFLGQNSMNR